MTLKDIDTILKLQLMGGAECVAGWMAFARFEKGSELCDTAMRFDVECTHGSITVVIAR